MFPETGHYTGTFRLASALRARGHRVVYLGLADFEDLVTARGFEFVAFAADLLPKGYVAEFAASLGRQAPRGAKKRLENRMPYDVAAGPLDSMPRSAWAWLGRQLPTAMGPLGRRPRREDEALFAAWLDRITGGPLDDAIRACRPDVVLCDPFVWYVGLRALALAIPTLNLCIVLHHHANSRIPPVITSMRPAKTALASLAVRLAWWRMHAEFFVTKQVPSRLLGAYRFPTRMHHLEDVFRDLAHRSGFEAVAGRTYHHGEMGPWLDLPAVVLCPRAFEFAEADVARKVFAGDVVDLDRVETPLDGAFVAADEASRDTATAGSTTDRPLIYASLGTSAHFYPHAPRFFRAMAAVAARRPDWRVVLHIGDHADAALSHAAPANLTLARRVPQLALLRRAAAMVTHGGMNSILECVRFQVPMVIVPAMRDQPGNAARAVDHGIALATRMPRVTAPRLEALIERARTDAAMRRALAETKRRIDAEPGLETILDFLQSHAAPTVREWDGRST